MQCWRSETEDEAIVESTILAEILLINHYFFKNPLPHNSTLLFVKCNTSTLYKISKMYKPLYISGPREEKEIIYEKKNLLIKIYKY